MDLANSVRVLDARTTYFEDAGFSDASYRDRWVRIKVGPIPVVFPNTRSRKRAIPLHDLHHVATGYATTFTGEAEIGAWELAGGCADYWAAWVLNFGSFGFGLAIAPRRVYRAFMRGRHSRTLYKTGWRNELLEISVGELRHRLELDAIDRPPTWTDRAVFAGFVAAAMSPSLAILAIGWMAVMR